MRLVLEMSKGLESKSYWGGDLFKRFTKTTYYHCMQLCFWEAAILIKTFLKRSFSIIRVGSSVRPERLALSFNLKLSYRFQTLHDDSYNSELRFRKRSNSIIRMSVRPFYNNFLCDEIILFIWFLEYWFLEQQSTML